MKVGVCIKQVPDTDTRIRVNAAGTGIETADVKWVTNPYDEYALELAMRLKDAKKATDVVVFAIGDASLDQRIRDSLARGADRGVRLDDASFAGSDSLGRARIFGAAAKKEGISLLFCGRQDIDDDQGAVPAMIAEVNGWNQVSWVDKVELEGETVKAVRVAGGGAKEVVTAQAPAVLSVDKLDKDPRMATLPLIMAAKKKPLAVVDAAGLGLAAGSVGAGAALVSEGNLGLPPARPAGRILKGDSAAAVAAELVRLLREEAKVI